MNQMGNQIKTIRVSNAVAAGVTTADSSVVDTAGAESVIFEVHFGAIVAGAATSVNAQQGTASDGSDAADLEGTSITVADTDDNKIARLEIVQPRERYVRCRVLRATANSTIDSIVAHLIYPRKAPITQDTTVLGYECHLSPAEGTA